MSSVKLPRDTPHKKRARYHSSVIDANSLNPGDEFTDLPECYVIFITENDVLEKDRIENAKKMINDGSLSLEKITEFSGLSIEKVRELAGNKSA